MPPCLEGAHRQSLLQIAAPIFAANPGWKTQGKRS